MFGIKIKEFENTQGTVKDFNTVFPNTPLNDVDQNTDVEILGITNIKSLIDPSNPFVRDIKIGDKLISGFDFGSRNFIDTRDWQDIEVVKYKYFCYDLDNNLVATAYTLPKLAEKLNCSIQTLRLRLETPITKESNVRAVLYNVKRREL